MADQILIPLSNVEHKRDSYGFAVRPQHLQRYREYGNIYKEEEEERSEKWHNFLEQCSESAQLCKPSVENLETSKTEGTSGNSDTVTQNDGERDSSGDKFTSNSTDVESKKDVAVVNEAKRRRIQTWAPIRPSLIPIENLMSVRVKKNRCMLNDHAHLLENHPPLVDEEICEKETSKVASQYINVDSETWDSSLTSKDSLSKFSTSPGQEFEIPVNSCQKDAMLSSCQDKAEIDGREESGNGVILTSESVFPWKEELESLVHGGVPKSLRGEVWQAFVGVRARKVDRYYQEMLSVDVDLGIDNGSSASLPEKLRKQIEKDLPRTFPGHPALDEEGRNSLRRILTAYARHNPSVGYCQAMNFFAGLLLLLMPEENAFWTLVGIIDEYFNGYFTQEMIESQVDQLVFEELLRERFPKLVNHLDFLGVEVAWVTGPWFLSIFVNMLPWESVLRVWDVILYEGNRVMLFRTALALMELYGPALVTTKDAGDAVTLLQSLTGSTFDSSQLVLTACMGFLSITETRLEELRNKHRRSVLGIIDERTKGTEVSKESKGLASKLYSFKHDAQSLMEDPNKNEKLIGKKIGSARSVTTASPDNFDDFIFSLSLDSEFDSVTDLQDQVVWLKVEFCRLMEEKRMATLRAEELETAFLEMVKEDNRRQLSAKVEQLEQETTLLRQALVDKQEQEHAMLQVLMRVEQEQKVTEDARIAAEQDLAAQKYAVHVLQEKYDKAMASIAEMEKRVKIAESMLEATLQYESGQAKAISSPRSMQADSPRTGRRTGLLSFGLGWRDRNKGSTGHEADSGESSLIAKSSRKDMNQSNPEEPRDTQPSNNVAEKSQQNESSDGHNEQ